ncbi:MULTISPECIES: Rv0361 family membrane protein [Gordonia]|uniref:DUF4878 domain-containing protein n=1 Tax=Gordonia sihwensis NBRC 108236 TaxID=1223544 RepID=L7LI10_9ACTN|nr:MULTISPECIES: hypothetical protein [Gordonia]AUH67928.1 hypothetical protein CXX93_05715 [Gordonia sp. YC-JH1]MBY4571418.1 hypothetical protein [Gordonia sihwensis]GAC60760.1 hypothetical protein GSI01S_11_01030 [Gordonia sihwensis NBRC 108236]
MNEDQPASHDLPEDDQPRSWKAALPMILAGALVVVLLAWVLIAALVNPPEERLSDSAQVQHTVNDMYSAMGTLNYDQYVGSFCQADVDAADFPKSVQFAEQNRAENEDKGKIVVPNMDVEVTGDSATVKAHWNRENTADDEQTTSLRLIRENGEWKVCNR